MKPGPVILPRQHRFTRLVIEECHQRVHHSGVRATLAELRSRYWVPRGRQVVKRILSECVTCRRFTGKPYSTPPTAALPDFRVKEAPPFSRVGVDFAGPLYVKEKSGQMGYGTLVQRSSDPGGKPWKQGTVKPGYGPKGTCHSVHIIRVSVLSGCPQSGVPLMK